MTLVPGMGTDGADDVRVRLERASSHGESLSDTAGIGRTQTRTHHFQSPNYITAITPNIVIDSI